MGRLQLLSISSIVLYGSVAIAVLSTNKKDLERAAELAVERAAEKAAERAVEKALNSGNSSTVTVTVKESYSNAMKTAEEAAAPGSESTRPYDPKIYDRQYGYSPPSAGYQVSDSAEAEELGISKESLNSSVEDLGASEAPDTEKSAETVDPAELSFESAKDVNDKSIEPTIPSSIKNLDTSTSLDFGADFVGLDISSDASFGLKSNTKTFSTSYSKTKDEFPEAKVNVDDDEDAEIFKMYATDFGEGGWSSAKQEGWVRHRPLWDDSKSRVSRDFWEDFSDISAGETRTKEGEKVPPEGQKVKRMVDPNSKNEQYAVPLATLTLDPKTPAALYRLLQREVKLPANGYDRVPIPMKVYVTIPVPYLSSHTSQKDYSKKEYTPKDYNPKDYNPKDYNPKDYNPKDYNPKNYSPKNYMAKEYDSKSSDIKPYDIPLPPKIFNDEMNDQSQLPVNDQTKKSYENGDYYSTEPERKQPIPIERSYRSMIKMAFNNTNTNRNDSHIPQSSA